MIWTWRGQRGPGPGRTVWWWCWMRSHSRGCRWSWGAPVCKLHVRRPQTVPEALSGKPPAGLSQSHWKHRKQEDKRFIFQAFWSRFWPLHTVCRHRSGTDVVISWFKIYKSTHSHNKSLTFNKGNRSVVERCINQKNTDFSISKLQKHLETD